MVSESQERMLAVVEPDRVAAVRAICDKWQTGSAEIGVITDTGQIRILRDGEVVGDMPVEALVDGCPLYDLAPAAPAAWIYGNKVTLPAGTDSANTLLALLAAPSIASKKWVFQQYDPIVGSRTVRRPEAADAAVLQLPESGNAIAVSIDGNGRRVACEPFNGTIEAVLECAQNLACVGAEPLGLTNCLNFGNPEKPVPAWQLDRAISGLAAVCEELGVPVVGGNVSLYNEGPDGPIYPTPVVAMVGELPDPAQTAPSSFVAEGDAIALLGPFSPTPHGSELTKQRGELEAGLPAPTSPRSPLPAPRSATRSAPERSPPPTTSATAALRARWPSARSAPGSAAAPTSSTCASVAAPRRRRSSARAPAASSSAARSSMRVATARPTRKALVTLVSSSRCQSALEKSCSGRRSCMPALLTRMSMGATSRSIVPTAASTAASSVTSKGATATLSPSARSSSATTARRSASRPLSTIRAPASPRPEPA